MLSRTIIEYVEVGNEIEIVAFDNVATRKDIAELFGKKAADCYFNDYPYYHQFIDSLGVANIHVCTRHNLPVRIGVGTKRSKVDFGWAVRQMKAAGERIGKLRRAKQIVI